MNVEDAARVLGITARTLRKILQKGEIAAKFVDGRTGRQYDIDEASLERYKARKSAGSVVPLVEEKKGRKLRKPEPEISSLGGPAFLTPMGPRIGKPSQYLNFLPDVLDVEQVAEFLRVSPDSVRNLLRDGSLHGLKLGRGWKVTRLALKRFIRKSSGEK